MKKIIIILSLITFWISNSYSQMVNINISIDSLRKVGTSETEYGLIITQNNETSSDVLLLKKILNKSYLRIYVKGNDENYKEIIYPKDFPYPKFTSINDSLKSYLIKSANDLEISKLYQKYISRLQEKSKKIQENSNKILISNQRLSPIEIDSVISLNAEIEQIYGKGVTLFSLRPKAENLLDEFINISFLSKGEYKIILDLPEYDFDKIQKINLGNKTLIK